MSSSFLSSDLPNQSISRLSQSSYRGGQSPSFHSTPTVRSSQQRNLSQLDSATPLAEYTTYRSQQYRSSSPPSSSHTQPHSAMRSTLTAYHDTAASSSNSSNVIGAFRDLQGKVKVIEQERYDAIREREELKALLLERKRNQNLERSKQEIETTESLLSIKARGEKLQREYNEMNQRIVAQEEIGYSLERKLSSQQALYNSLHEDIARQQHKYISLEKHNLQMKSELHQCTLRCEQVEDNVKTASPQLHNKQQHRLLRLIEDCETKLHKVQLGKQKSAAKLQSLHTYMDLIIKINGDLCDTLHSREKAKHKLLKMSRSLSPPPRYAWPKEVPYHNVLHVINEAAKATANAAIESNAIHATETAMKQVIRALTPPRKYDQMMHDVLEEASSSASTSSSEDEHLEHVRSGRQRGSPIDHLTQSLSQLGLGSSGHGKYYLKTNSVNGTPSKRAISFDEHVDMRSDDDGDYAKRKKGKKSKKTKKRASTGASSSSNQAHHLVNTSNRKQTLHKVIARQGAITSATRLAAAANAASMTIKVHPDNSFSSSHRSKSRGNTSTPAADANKVSFIPAGGSKNSEFNIVASVSKASRAAKQLNATIASRVKSLHSGGVGTIFDEVPRVELLDMQHQLAAVKMMRDSLVSM